MKPISLIIENFKSFTKAEFQFPSEPGLFFLYGDNKDEPRLEANAAGKTTVWDAFYWLLYGTTTRGVKGGEVANWDAGKGAQTSVTLDYDVDGVCYVARRRWNPISWQICTRDEAEWRDLAKDEANELMTHVGLDRLPCLHSIFMAQAQPMFLDLPAKDKASLFSEVMGLDRWLGYSAKASTLAATEDRGIRDLERELSEAWGRADTLAATDYSEDVREWAGKQTQKREVLADRVDALQSRAVKARDELSGVVVARERAQTHLDRLKRALEGELTVQRGAVSGWAPCPTCGTPVPPKAAPAPTSRVPQLTGEVAEAKEDLANADRRVRELTREVGDLDDQARQLEDDVKYLLEQVNPFTKKQAEVDADLRAVTDKIENLQARLDDSKARHSRLSFWVRGFKDLRLQLISETLQQLEIEVNSCLTQLGLIDWELRFDVDRETKGGTMARGFSVKVLSPRNKHLVPWEAWSGGESQRLRIAATMGLSNLIRSSTGTQLGIEVWDEPTQFLSGQGVTDLLDSLAERARVEKRQVWVVDHRSLGFGGFNGIFTVVKDQNGSHIRNENI